MVFSKFKNKKKKNSAGKNTNTEEVFRVRTPKEGEILGILEQRLGGSRARVRCMDGKTRICRIPGRLKRHLWVREGDTILVEPWEFGGDEKGDIIFKYRIIQVKWLQKNGFLNNLAGLDEF
jgi:translation initiation factor 1A